MESCELTCFVYSRDLLRAVWSLVTLLRMAERAEVGLLALLEEEEAEALANGVELSTCIRGRRKLQKKRHDLRRRG